MPEIRFYHLLHMRPEKALPRLLEKALEGGRRVVVFTPDSATTEGLNAHLWTYDPASFLPHGTAREGRPDCQPIWITHHPENPSGASVLICIQGACWPDPQDGGFSLCCELFDGNDPAAVQTARARWASLKAAGHLLTYWQQTDSGGWEQKATTAE